MEPLDRKCINGLPSGICQTAGIVSLKQTISYFLPIPVVPVANKSLYSRLNLYLSRMWCYILTLWPSEQTLRRLVRRRLIILYVMALPLRVDIKTFSQKTFDYLFVHLQSEEMQLKRKKENNESQALPPPVPPKLKPQFYPMVNLLQSDVMIYLMELVLSRAAAVKSKSLSETQLERVRTVING